MGEIYKEKRIRLNVQEPSEELLKIKENNIYYFLRDGIFYECVFSNLRKNFLTIGDTPNEKKCIICCHENSTHKRNFSKSSKKDCIDHLTKHHLVRCFCKLFLNFFKN